MSVCLPRLRPALALTFALLLAPALPVMAAQIGSIYVCYRCGTTSTGIAAIDTFLSANSLVDADGPVFAIHNTGSAAITGGVLSENGSPADSFTFPSIAANSWFFVAPWITDDGQLHTVSGLFSIGPYLADTSDGDGGVDNSTLFTFSGTYNGQAVQSLTRGVGPANGTFFAGDSGLIFAMPPTSVDDPGLSDKLSFLGFDENGIDNGNENCLQDCYFAQVATLNTPADASAAVPEPSAAVLLGAGLGVVALLARRRRK